MLQMLRTTALCSETREPCVTLHDILAYFIAQYDTGSYMNLRGTAAIKIHVTLETAVHWPQMGEAVQKVGWRGGVYYVFSWLFMSRVSIPIVRETPLTVSSTEEETPVIFQF